MKPKSESKSERPSLLRIGVLTHSEEGCFHVSFASPEEDVFERAVELLKQTVPKGMRSYDKEAHCWNFHPKAKPSFDGWLGVCRKEWNAEVHYKEGSTIAERSF